VSLNDTHQRSLYYSTRKVFVHSPITNWTHSAIFSAFLAELNCRLTAHLELRNSTAFSAELFVITTLHGPNRKHRSQNFFYCFSHVRCHGNLFTETLPSNGRLFWLQYSSLMASCQYILHLLQLNDDWLHLGWFIRGLQFYRYSNLY
jgi:hypothetical protein